MGVNGLWQVVQPCARPTNLATLNRKRLAVDASIWIYQFLKAVRDKEGHALRNSHVVGFFRRICKLLWFGIRPVFVFDGGAPSLKRQTILGRKKRREGRREDAVRTAGKLLAVQMQRIADEEAEKRKKALRGEVVEEPEEAIPDVDKLVYVDEIGMSQRERLKSRKFFKQDAYHLPELDGTIASMGGANDPRIMSIEELEEYARQFHSGEDINLYDFSKIDFDGDFFCSLPPVDRYNILNAARLRSRLRMGLSKDQLDDMFPDRMAFSRFQIERVKERNNLTQRLMREAGMTGLDLTLGAGGGRIAGDKDREYILVKNDGVEGGWALGVVSKDKDVGKSHKPIDVDAIQIQYESKDGNNEDLDDDEFEDIPIEGLNRLPKLPADLQVERGLQVARDLSSRRHQHHGHQREVADAEEQIPSENSDDDDGLFVTRRSAPGIDDLFEDPHQQAGFPDEEADINKAIEISLRNQHGVRFDLEDESPEADFEDVTIEPPQWEQRAVETAKPITTTSGKMVAHIVNNRSNAAVPKRRNSDAASGSDSDSDMDLQAVLAKSRKLKQAKPTAAPANVKNPFDGPLPFPKLDWKSSLFQPRQRAETQHAESGLLGQEDDEDDLAGGFERQADHEAPRPLPPWMTDDTDIRENLKKQVEAQNIVNAEDREMAEEEERVFQEQRANQLIEIDSSDGGDSDIEIVEAPPPQKSLRAADLVQDPVMATAASRIQSTNPIDVNLHPEEEADINQAIALSLQDQQMVNDVTQMSILAESSPEPEFEEVEDEVEEAASRSVSSHDTPEPEFEDVAPRLEMRPPLPESPELDFEDVEASGLLTVEGLENSVLAPDVVDEDLFGKDEVDEFSDPEEEELLAQMAQEAEEHARFASELNNKSEKENLEAYERELRALRSQQKKDRRDADEVTQAMVTECQALLRLFGIPYITAPMEAEAQCAELVHLSLVDGIVTDDSDIFLFGGTRVYKNMFNSNKFVECYLTTDLEKELSLSREQLIALAQLLGSDYTEGLQGVGPVTAVEILSEFPGRDGLEEFKTWWQDIQIHSRPKEADAGSTFRRKFRKSQATKLFLPPGFPSPAVYDAYLRPEVDKSTEQFQWGVPDVEGLRQFLMSTIGWSKERTDEVLVPVVKDMNRRDIEGTQANITRYFEGSIGVGAKEAFAPRQRAKGSKRMADAVSKLRAKAVSEMPSETADDGSGGAVTRRKRKNQARVVDDEEDEDADVDADEAELTDDSEAANRQSRNRGKRARALG